MKSQEYWRKRAEQVANRQFEKSDRYTAGLKRQYEQSLKSIQRDLESFYVRFAENNEVSMAEAKRLLTAGELAEFKMTLSEFRKKAKNNADGQWTKELDNVYYRTRVTRLEALQLQVRQQVEMLAASQQAGIGKLLGDIYEGTYHRTLFELNKGGNGILASFARADKEAVQEVISRPWYGKNYSSRIWDDRDKLLRELRTGLSQSFIRGDSAKKVSALLAKRMGVATSTAERLVLTESAHIINEATADGYMNSGVVQQYEVLATLDSKTSETCRVMDGKVFNLSEREVSINYPPFHARCRTTVTAYFDDEVDPGKRIAKDHTGKRIYIPADMKYEDWKKEYIDSPAKSNNGIIESKQPLRFGSEKEVKDWEAKVTPQWLESLTDEERESIRTYTGSSYRDINRSLRSGEDGGLFVDTVKHISAGLHKFKLDQDIIVYRGLDDNIFGMPANELPGVQFKDLAFASTSLLESKSFGGKIKMEIRVPTNVKGACINPLSKYKDEEYEFLLDRETEFLIKEATEEFGTINIKAEVIVDD